MPPAKEGSSTRPQPRKAARAKRTRPPQGAAASNDSPDPRKAAAAKKAAARAGRATTKKVAKKTVTVKKVPAKKIGAVRTGAPPSAGTRARRAEVRRETDPVPRTEAASPTGAAPPRESVPPSEPAPPSEPVPVEGPPPRPPPPPPPPAPPAPSTWAPPAWAPPAWPPGPPAPAHPPSPGIDSLAITAMVLGIVAVPMFFFFVPAILAIVLGLLGRRNIKREPAKGGKGMATAGVVLGILSLLGGILMIVGLAAWDDDSGSDTPYSLLQPGNCYDTDIYDERNIDFRSCSEDHYREAFAVLDHPAPPLTEYPGRESLRRYAIRECTARFPAYVGRAYEDSRLRLVVVFPPRDEWDEENLRRIVCAAARPDDGDLTRSVRDSRI